MTIQDLNESYSVIKFDGHSDNEAIELRMKLMEDLSLLSFVNALGASLVSAVVYGVLLRICGVIPHQIWVTVRSGAKHTKLFCQRKF